MSLGLVGRKVGMTRVFAEDGSTVPVTVLDVSNNRVTQIKTPETDGYAAVQVTFGKRRANRVSKPMAGHLAKAGAEVLAIGEHHHHPMRIGEAPHIGFLLLGHPPPRQLQAPTSAPGRDPIDAILGPDDPQLAGSPQ